MSTINSTGVRAGWGFAGDRHVVMKGRSHVSGAKNGIIYCPAYGQGAAGALSAGVTAVLADWGYPVVACDLGGARLGGVEGAASVWLGDSTRLHLWSNDDAIAGMDAIHNTIMPAIGGVPPYGIIVGSGGGAVGKVWAHNNPTLVGALLGIIAVVSLQDCVTNNRLSTATPPVKASIQAALDMGVSEVVPGDRDPGQMADTWPLTIPVRHYYSGQDEVCIPQITRDWCDAVEARGGQAEAIQHNDLNHNFFAGLPIEEAAGWLVRNL